MQVEENALDMKNKLKRVVHSFTRQFYNIRTQNNKNNNIEADSKTQQKNTRTYIMICGMNVNLGQQETRLPNVLQAEKEVNADFCTTDKQFLGHDTEYDIKLE